MKTVDWLRDFELYVLLHDERDIIEKRAILLWLDPFKNTHTPNKYASMLLLYLMSRFSSQKITTQQDRAGCSNGHISFDTTGLEYGGDKFRDCARTQTPIIAKEPDFTPNEFVILDWRQ